MRKVISFGFGCAVPFHGLLCEIYVCFSSDVVKRWGSAGTSRVDGTTDLPLETPGACPLGDNICAKET